MLQRISPASLRLERMRYLDCAGLILSVPTCCCSGNPCLPNPNLDSGITGSSRSREFLTSCSYTPLEKRSLLSGRLAAPKNGR
jgi:hypothetical protein